MKKLERLKRERERDREREKNVGDGLTWSPSFSISIAVSALVCSLSSRSMLATLSRPSRRGVGECGMLDVAILINDLNAIPQLKHSFSKSFCRCAPDDARVIEDVLARGYRR